MKTFIAFLIVGSIATGALAQASRGSGGGLGTFKSGSKPVASAKDLDKAEGFAAQARSRLGTAQKSGSSGWLRGGSGSSGKRSSR